MNLIIPEYCKTSCPDRYKCEKINPEKREAILAAAAMKAFVEGDGGLRQIDTAVRIKAERLVADTYECAEERMARTHSK